MKKLSIQLNTLFLTFLLANPVWAVDIDTYIGPDLKENTNWSLPFNDDLNKDSGETPKKIVSRVKSKPSSKQVTLTNNGQSKVSKKNSTLKAEVSLWDEPKVIASTIEHLVDVGYSLSPQAALLDKEVENLSTKHEKNKAMAKDSLNYAVGYKGCGPSVDIGKLLLGKDVRTRDLYIAALRRQQLVDQMHENIVAALMQISEAMGMNDESRQNKLLNDGLNKLKGLVGEEEAINASKTLNDYFNNLVINKRVFNQMPWDSVTRQDKLKSILTGAVVSDPVIKQVKQQFEKYANPSFFKRAANSTVQTSLNAASFFAPGLIVPGILQAVLTGFIASTGGSEQNKIQTEFLLDKRIQSRVLALNNEASLTLDNYRYAQVTHNACLLAFSRSVIGYLSGTHSSAVLKSLNSNADNKTIAKSDEANY